MLHQREEERRQKMKAKNGEPTPAGHSLHSLSNHNRDGYYTFNNKSNGTKKGAARAHGTQEHMERTKPVIDFACSSEGKGLTGSAQRRGPFTPILSNLALVLSTNRAAIRKPNSRGKGGPSATVFFSYLGNILPVVFLRIELDHVAVDHLPYLPRAVPVAPSHAIASHPSQERKQQKGKTKRSGWRETYLWYAQRRTQHARNEGGRKQHTPGRCGGRQAEGGNKANRKTRRTPTHAPTLTPTHAPTLTPTPNDKPWGQPGCQAPGRPLLPTRQPVKQHNQKHVHKLLSNDPSLPKHAYPLPTSPAYPLLTTKGTQTRL